MTPAEREQIMQNWDKWRGYIADGGGGSWPRDAFESLLDEFDEAVAEREREIARLTLERSALLGLMSGKSSLQKEWSGYRRLVLIADAAQRLVDTVNGLVGESASRTGETDA